MFCEGDFYVRRPGGRRGDSFEPKLFRPLKTKAGIFATMGFLRVGCALGVIAILATRPRSFVSLASSIVASVVYLALFLVAAFIAVHFLSIVRDDKKRAKLRRLLRGTPSDNDDRHLSSFPGGGRGLVDTENLNEGEGGDLARAVLSSSSAARLLNRRWHVPASVANELGEFAELVVRSFIEQWYGEVRCPIAAMHSSGSGKSCYLTSSLTRARQLSRPTRQLIAPGTDAFPNEVRRLLLTVMGRSPAETRPTAPIVRRGRNSQKYCSYAPIAAVRPHLCETGRVASTSPKTFSLPALVALAVQASVSCSDMRRAVFCSILYLDAFDSYR